MLVEAFAKVNLSLQVRPPRDDGMHPIRSLVQSIDWADNLHGDLSDDDRFTVTGADLPADEDNLAWRAVDALRRASARRQPVALSLVKEIPVAAGLGGGSADAAAALVLTARLLGLSEGVAEGLAGDLGSDVPFCLAGGTRWVEGIGDRLSEAPPAERYALAVVVPPFELATGDVYRRWDLLEGPEGPALDGRDLPVVLRGLGVLRNDLAPAALSLEPGLGDWMADLARRWGVPVAMSGSGPALFGCFPTLDEAADAAAVITGVRAARGCRPVGRGWRFPPVG